MAITKEDIVETIRVVGGWNIEIATDTVIKEDGTEISRSRQRHVLKPFSSTYKTKEVDGVIVDDLDKDGKKKWTHTDTDISNEASQVQAVANAIWTNKIKSDYKNFKESQN